MEATTRSTHPLVLVAAVSVTVASLAAAAHFLGFTPSRGNEAPAAVVAQGTNPASSPVAASLAAPQEAAPAPAPQAEKPAPVHHAKPAARAPQRQVREPSHQAADTSLPSRDDSWHNDGGTRRVANNDAGIDVVQSRPAVATSQVATPPVCHDCGTVESVREVAVKGEGSGLGAVAGGVLGGVLGHQVGGGKGRDLATIAGAVGGAFAGHQVEKNVRSEKQYEVMVRFDDGSQRSYKMANANWRSGDRVKAANGGLVAAAGER